MVDEVALHVQHVLRGEAADVGRHVVAVQQRYALFPYAIGDVIDQLAAHTAGGDDVKGGDETLSDPAYVCVVRGRTLRAELGQHQVGTRVAVDPSDL